VSSSVTIPVRLSLVLIKATPVHIDSKSKGNHNHVCLLAVGDMDGWRSLHPDEWSDSDVLDFIFSLKDINPEMLRGEQFRALTGSELCRLSLQEFTLRDPQYGQLIHRQLQSLLHQRQYIHLSMTINIIVNC